MVNYATDDGERGGLDLLRLEETLPDDMEKTINVSEGQLMSDQLAYFRLRYLDEETNEWRESWDSTDIELLDRLPQAVEVSVQLFEHDSAGEMVEGEEPPTKNRSPKAHKPRPKPCRATLVSSMP